MFRFHVNLANFPNSRKICAAQDKIEVITSKIKWDTLICDVHPIKVN